MSQLYKSYTPNGRRGISRLGWIIRAILAAISLSVIALGAAPSEKKMINLGTPDDPYMVEQRPTLTTAAKVTSILSPASVNGVSDVFLGSIDASLFPLICTYVEVLDPNGLPIPHLPADSFCVYQDGFRMSEFTIQELTGDSCRTSTCLVIDVSGSMGTNSKITAAKDAARRFVRAMSIYDRTAIVKFSDCYTVVQNFTSDTALLISGINSLSASGRTAFFDGTWKGVSLTTTELGSKAVIALTDGLENESQNCGTSATPNGLNGSQPNNGFTDDSTLIVGLALGAGIPIYTISLGSDFDPHYLVSLSNGSGGSHFHAPSGAELDSIYDAIKERLCTRYKICYNSIDTIPDGDCHQVVVCHQNADLTCAPCDTGDYCEKAPPVIKRTPPTIALDNICQKAKTNVQLCAWVTDKDTPLASLTVNLFYRNGPTSYTSVATTRTDSTFCATVPASQLLCSGDSIQYYFTASDGEHTVATPSNAPIGHHAFPICPTIANAGPDKALTCLVSQVQLSGSSTPPGINFSWTATGGGHIVSGGSTATPTVDAAGTYVLTVTDPSNSCTDKDTALVTVNTAKPNANAGPDKVLTCTVTQVNLDGSSTTPSATFSWAVAAGGHIVSGGSTATPLVDAAGTYILTVTDPANGCTKKDTALVTVDTAKPNANAGADKVLTCLVTQINLSGSSSTPGATFSWGAFAGGHIVSGGTTASPLVDAAGTYVLTVTNPANGCTKADTALVTANTAPPNANAGPDKVLNCIVVQVNLAGSSSTPSATFSWAAYDGGHIVSGGSTATPLVDSAGTYVLTVTNPANGCTKLDTALVTSNVSKPNANAGPDKFLNCEVSQVNLSGSSTTPGAAFSWLASNGGHIVSGSTTASPLVDAPGTYTLTVTDPANGCTATDGALVTRDISRPNVNAGADQVLTCANTLDTLHGSSSTPGVNFSWSAYSGGHIVSGASSPSPIVDAAGTYVLMVTNPETHCSAYDTALVTIDRTKPVLTCAGDDLTCDSLLATASVISNPAVGVTYEWKPAPVSGQGTAIARYDSPGSKWVIVTNPANGCVDSCEATITQNIRKPNLTCTGDTLTCNTVMASVSVSTNITEPVSYNWDPAPLSGQGSSHALYNAPGAKKVVVTILSSGCKDSCEAIVEQNAVKPVPICSGDDLTCDSLLATASVLLGGQSKSLTNISYFWTPAPVSGQGTNLARYDTPGFKKVVVTVLDSGCKDSCEAEITQHIAKPELSCHADSITCNKLQATATVQSSVVEGITYFWNPAPVSGQGTSQAVYDSPGIKWVTVTIAATGCKDSCSVDIVQDTYKPKLLCAGDELTCDSLQATASVSIVLDDAKIPPPLTFFWSPDPLSGQGTPWARYDTPGPKKVVVTYTPTGCKDSCEATITQNTRRPEISCGADTITCVHPQATAWVNSSPSEGVSYFWNPAPITGQGTTQAVYDTPGIKVVVVTILATGCKDSCLVDVQQNIYKPVLSCSGDQLTCDSLEATASVQLVSAASKIPFPFTFYWTPEPISGQGTQEARYNTPGTKWVVVTYTPSGCKDSCSAEIAQDVIKPLLSCSGDELTCDSLLASATVNLTDAQKLLVDVWGYFWSPAPISGQGTPFARYDTPGTKWVVVTYLPTGCKDSCSSVITQNIIKPSISCHGDELTCDSLLATASVSFDPSKILNGVTYLWAPEPISGQGTQWARYDAPGWKKVVVTFTATGCKDSCEANITQNTRRPEVACGADTITCAHPHATAWVNSGPSVGVSYFWDPAPLSGQGTTQAVYDTPGIKRVVVTILESGCKDTCTVDIQENLYKPQFICSGDELTCDSLLATASLQFPSAGSQAFIPFLIVWSPEPISGQGTPWARYDTPGQKKVVVTYGPTGCKDSCEATITQSIDKPFLSCSGDELTCDSLLASASVNFIEQAKNPNPAVYSYVWSPAPISGQGTPNARYDSPGTKWVVVTVLETGCKDSCSAVITQKIEKPSLSCSGDVLTCDSLQATASVTIGAPGQKTNGTVIIVWSPAPLSGQGTPFARYDTPGTKWVVVTDLASGCKDSCSAEIMQNARTPEFGCSGDELTCDSVLATASVNLPQSGKALNGFSYLWKPSPVSGQGTPFARYDTPGTKWVIITIPETGCKDSCAATITQNIFKPELQCFGDTLTCDSLQGTACVYWFDASKTSTPILSYQWRPEPVSGQGTACARYDTPGQKWAIVTFLPNGCKDSCAATIVHSNAVPNANAGTDKVLTCTVTQLSLSGSSSTPGVTFTWVATAGGHIVSGGTTATPTVDAAGTYTLTVTNPTNGCKATDVALVTLNNTAPNANAGADKILTCTATQLNLSGSSSTPGATFSWVASAGGHIVSGANTATPLIDQPGTYTLTVTNPANGCTATDVASVTRNNTAPNADAGADKVLTCSVTQINLSGSSSTPGVTFSWAASAGGHIVSGGNTATPLVDQPGTYTLTVTNPTNGCTATDVALVTRNATTPNVSAGVDKVLNCSVTQINLSGSSSTPGVTFSWVASAGGHIVSGGTTATPLVDQPGTYTLTVTVTATGCKASDAATVTLDNTLPNADAGPDKALTCTITQISLSGASSTPGATFSWAATNGGHIVSGPTTATPVVDAAGTYTLTVTNPANGCMATDVALVTKTPNNPPVCVVPHDTSITTTTVPVTICLPVSGTDVDGDAVTCTKISGAGTLSGGQWCFTWSAPKDTSVLVEIRCRDACDSCSSQFRVTILYRSLIPPCEGNIAPICNLPRDTTIMQCIPTTISLPVSATDANGNFKSCTIVSGPGKISSRGNWNYTPYGPDTVTVTIRCTDSCGAFCEGTFTVSFVRDNLKPVCKPVLDTTVHACPSIPIMIPLYANAIGLVDCYVSGGLGTLIGGYWVYTPTVNEDVRATVQCQSVCGNTWKWSLTVRIRMDGTNCSGGSLSALSNSVPMTAMALDPCRCPAPGDIDTDGQVSVSDLAILCTVVFEAEKLNDTGACPAIQRCDVNCDGVVNRKDVDAVTSYIFSQGKPLCDPCPKR